MIDLCSNIASTGRVYRTAVSSLESLVPAMPATWRVLCFITLYSQAYAFIRRGVNCEENTILDFGFDAFTSCHFTSSDCYSLRERIVDSINLTIKEMETLDDGLGQKVPLILRPWNESDQEVDNTTDSGCRVPVAVQLKILYNSVRFAKNRYSIVGASLSIDEQVIPVDKHVRLTWSVLFREVIPKSNTSRWWEEMTSRSGSSYSFFWILDGFFQEGSPPGTYLFIVGLAAVSCLLVLKPYY